MDEQQQTTEPVHGEQTWLQQLQQWRPQWSLKSILALVLVSGITLEVSMNIKKVLEERPGVQNAQKSWKNAQDGFLDLADLRRVLAEKERFDLRYSSIGITRQQFQDRVHLALRDGVEDMEAAVRDMRQSLDRLQAFLDAHHADLSDLQSLLQEFPDECAPIIAELSEQFDSSMLGRNGQKKTFGALAENLVGIQKQDSLPLYYDEISKIHHVLAEYNSCRARMMWIFAHCHEQPATTDSNIADAAAASFYLDYANQHAFRAGATSQVYTYKDVGASDENMRIQDENGLEPEMKQKAEIDN